MRPDSKLIVPDITTVNSESLKIEQGNDASLKKYWDMAKNNEPEVVNRNSSVSYVYQKRVVIQSIQKFFL